MNRLTLAEKFKEKHEKPEKSVRGIYVTRQERLQTNRYILEQIFRGILYCTKQGIEIEEDIKNDSNNPGNLLALLKDYARHDEILFEHICKPKYKNATYMSPDTQDKIFNILGDIPKAELLEEVRAAKFFAIVAYEVSNHCREQLPPCVHFVNQKVNIREESLKFIALERIIGEASFFLGGGAIVKTLEDSHLDINYLRGQT